MPKAGLDTWVSPSASSKDAQTQTAPLPTATYVHPGCGGGITEGFSVLSASEKSELY